MVEPDDIGTIRTFEEIFHEGPADDLNELLMAENIIPIHVSILHVDTILNMCTLCIIPDILHSHYTTTQFLFHSGLICPE